MNQLNWWAEESTSPHVALEAAASQFASDKNVDSVFEDETGGLDFNAKLAKRVREYVQQFVTKNQDHIEFFGGKLLGVQVVRFTDTDRNRWFHEILEVDEGPLEDRLLNLKAIEKEYFVSSDTMNLSCVWMCHKFLTSKQLGEKERKAAARDALMIMHFKFMTSLLAHYFKYPAERGLAEATYDELSKKFTIKNVDSWYNWFEQRCDSIIEEDGIHHHTLRNFQDDLEIVKLLNDTQGRVRDVMKNIYEVMMNLHQRGIRVGSTSRVLSHDGVEILKDISKAQASYGRYLNSVISDRNSFIRPELVTVIEHLQTTMDPRMFMKTLTWMSDNYGVSTAKVIEEVLNNTLIHSFRYLSDNRRVVQDTSNIADFVLRLRGVYTASRSTDPELLELREKMERIVTMATGNKNPTTVASVRTGALLYVVLRAFTMRHYTQSVV